MLKMRCIHPEILSVLSLCGHGDKVLIADGNFALDSNVKAGVRKVYLNLTHGIPTVTDVLSVMKDTISIEKVEVMIPHTGVEPEVFRDFRIVLGDEIQLTPLKKPEFYAECLNEKLKLGIESGDQRTFANILLTIGVVQKF